jgi:hypothetical protein
LHQCPEAAVQPDLCFPTEVLDALGLMFLAFTEFFTDLRRQGVVLRAFDQKPARMGIAALGDCALVARGAGTVLRPASATAIEILSFDSGNSSGVGQ